MPLATEQLIEGLNPLLRGWGEYYKRAHVRKLFNQLDRWIVGRIWSHRFKRWRNCGWKQLPTATLFGEYGLVNLRENCVHGLGGGRWPASGQLDAPPPTRHL